ncbi:MAG: FkbM family methyltransferase [Candidatus Omnitrophica bacterium]|nr:FkbM family methyltransferase [Candidatus Omnitrophota bacterium]
MVYENLISFLSFGQIFGIKSLVLFYYKKWHLLHLPFSLPVFGRISHPEELRNIRDNILQGTIRDRLVEKQIRAADGPVIVDCGINVGISVRWWFFLNSRSRVYGFDMMREANDFTTQSLPERFQARYVPITAVLAGQTGPRLDIRYEDPLFGGNSILVSGQDRKKRQVEAITLDDGLAPYDLRMIDFLKVDIEDSAAAMFRGASRTLPKVKNILLEIHSDQERDDSLAFLASQGFRVRKAFKRHIWFDKPSTKN